MPPTLRLRLRLHRNRLLHLPDDMILYKNVAVIRLPVPCLRRRRRRLLPRQHLLAVVTLDRTRSTHFVVFPYAATTTATATTTAPATATAAATTGAAATPRLLR